MTEAQIDTPTRARKKAKRGKRKPAPARKVKKGTAVAIDDPRKRQQLAARQPAEPPPSNLLAAIIRASTDPACDTGKMRELLAMQKDIVAEERRIAFDEAFTNLQAELPAIGRDGKIEIRKKGTSGERDGEVQQATPYATFPGMMKVVQPFLTKYGFGLSFETEPMADGRLLVRGILSLRGHERRTAFPLPAEVSGSKNNVQGWGSSLSYGKRYCTIALLNIVTNLVIDADTDGHQGAFKNAKGGALIEGAPEVETLTDDETHQLRQKIASCLVPVAKVLAHYDIKNVAELPRNLLASAIKQCEDYAANQARVKAEREGKAGFPGDTPMGGGRGR